MRVLNSHKNSLYILVFRIPYELLLSSGNKPLLIFSNCPMKKKSLGFEQHSKIVAVNARKEPKRKLNSV